MVGKKHFLHLLKALSKLLRDSNFEVAGERERGREGERERERDAEERERERDAEERKRVVKN
jgi:hypothetical protein